MKEFTARHFRSWLEARSPHGSVGEAGRPLGCPLATYLGPGWRVRNTVARYVEPGRFPGVRGPEVLVVRLPAWARRFVRAVDALPRYGGVERRVWPGTALRLLDEAVARREESPRGDH